MEEGSFKAAEARYTDVEQVPTEKLARWLYEARFIQWDDKNLVRRKGRLEPSKYIRALIQLTHRYPEESIIIWKKTAAIKKG